MPSLNLKETCVVCRGRGGAGGGPGCTFKPLWVDMECSVEFIRTYCTSTSLWRTPLGPSWLSCIQWNLSMEDTIGTQLAVLYTVEPLYRGQDPAGCSVTVVPLYRGHHWDPAGCSVYSGTSLWSEGLRQLQCIVTDEDLHGRNVYILSVFHCNVIAQQFAQYRGSTVHTYIHIGSGQCYASLYTCTVRVWPPVSSDVCMHHVCMYVSSCCHKLFSKAYATPM